MMKKRFWLFHGLNVGVLTLCLLRVLSVWDILPAKIPVHFGIAGTPDCYSDKLEGLILFLVAPVVLTVILYGSAWLVPQARRWPSLMNMPRKDEFLALPDEVQAIFYETSMDFLFLLTVILNMMFYFITEGTIAVAMGKATTLSGWAVWPGLAMTLLVSLVYTIRLVRLPGKLIDATPKRDEG